MYTYRISEIILAHSTVELYPDVKKHEAGMYIMTQTDSQPHYNK